MVVKEDGTKWACNSCLKGHRVSGCNHTDRELQLVPKKGRPVTQCQHCRQERKKRSAHVSCDCAAPDKPHHTKEKCIHLREAEERAKTAGFFDGAPHEKDHALLTTVAEEQGCCCSHGGRCSCALLRKDSSDDGLPHGKPAVSKPRLETTKSDGSLTIFTNGHHKPVHRKNHAAHECGMPYKMPMPRSKTEHDVNYAARRSVDSLALDPRSPQIDFPKFNSQAFQLKAEHTSPREMNAELFSSANGLTSDKFNMVDYSDLAQISTNESLPSAAGDAFPPFDQMSTLLESPFDNWPSLQGVEAAMPNNNPFGAWTTDAAGMVQPALTVASSGTQSEIDEIPSMDDPYTHGMPSIQEINFDLNDPMLGNSLQTNRRSLPPSFFGNLDFTNSVEDWQAEPSEGITNNDKPSTPSFVFTDPWQANMRVSTTYASPGRPMARSVGPGSAPSADIMKQLFPDMDVETNANGYRPRMQDPSNSISVSEEDDTLVSQPWADGSLSVPMDPYGTPLGMDAGFGGPDFSAHGWSQ
ncbi:hypothetical protein AMS68_007433 [Peltaster fructicola]|uniref:Copper-fist domain-containing protein n=1 Tax=Peltaster fructicola TaxID=286661 RepID=A0A6H0Y4M8_9PEZI|nr:hypothetical protein AMS68_007433 [Peltaster fructicola]